MNGHCEMLRLRVAGVLVFLLLPALAAGDVRAPNGRVTPLPDVRVVRWYATIGLVDRPLGMRGRTALYGPRHLYQLVAVKRRQAQGHTLADIQAELTGATDAVLMRIADMALSLPFLPFVIVLTGFLGASTSNIVLAVAVLLWPNSARVIRSQVLTLRERAYVEAARVTGASSWRILFVHIAPNILPLSFVYAAIAIGWAIITEASVSFLGFGDSESVSWGYMLQDAFSSQALSRGQYAWFVPPGVCIILVVVAGFFISRGYEEVFMPRLRGR